MSKTDDLPCKACGVTHRSLPAIPFDQSAPLAVAAHILTGPFMGRIGVVVEWSRYGTDLYYRIDLGRTPAGMAVRENYRPCEVRLWKAPRAALPLVEEAAP